MSTQELNAWLKNWQPAWSLIVTKESELVTAVNKIINDPTKPTDDACQAAKNLKAKLLAQVALCDVAIAVLCPPETD